MKTSFAVTKLDSPSIRIRRLAKYVAINNIDTSKVGIFVKATDDLPGWSDPSPWASDVVERRRK